MSNVKKYLMVVLCVTVVSVIATAFAADEAKPADAPKAAAEPKDDPELEKIAKESEEAAKESAKDKATSELIVKKLTAASELLEKEGDAAFSKFKGKGSEYIFGGTYITIHDLGTAEILMHPIKYKMVGKSMIGMKDKNGKLFIAEMNKLAREKGAGWISYYWPKPGDKEPSLKVTYVKYCKIKGGREVVLSCGIYDVSEQDIKKLTDGK
jgi:signal transduction histidine kinase